MRKTFQTQRQPSRAKMGLSLLACVLAALAAGQVAASPSSRLVVAFQEVSP